MSPQFKKDRNNILIKLYQTKIYMKTKKIEFFLEIKTLVKDTQKELLNGKEMYSENTVWQLCIYKVIQMHLDSANEDYKKWLLNLKKSFLDTTKNKQSFEAWHNEQLEILDVYFHSDPKIEKYLTDEYDCHTFVESVLNIHSPDSLENPELYELKENNIPIGSCIIWKTEDKITHGAIYLGRSGGKDYGMSKTGKEPFAFLHELQSICYEGKLYFVHTNLDLKVQKYLNDTAKELFKKIDYKNLKNTSCSCKLFNTAIKNKNFEQAFRIISNECDINVLKKLLDFVKNIEDFDINAKSSVNTGKRTGFNFALYNNKKTENERYEMCTFLLEYNVNITEEEMNEYKKLKDNVEKKFINNKFH